MIKKYFLMVGVLTGLCASTSAVSQTSQYTPIFPSGTYEVSVPVSFTPCANDFQNCKILTDQVGMQNLVSVFYGARGKYVVSQGTGDFKCEPSTFGISDPLPMVKKTCWVFASFANNSDAITAGSPNTTIESSVPTGMRSCAVDFATCSQAGIWIGVYGANGVYKNIAGTGDFSCVPGTFGLDDPVPNVQKTCSVKRVPFDSFTLQEAAPLLSTLVPGVTYSYSLESEDGGNKLWGVGWNDLTSGNGVSNLPSLTPYSLVIHFGACPGYSIFAYGRKSIGCNMGLTLPETEARMEISASVTGAVSYTVTDTVIYPTLSVK